MPSLKVVDKLPGSDEYAVKYFLNHWVTILRFREDFVDEVNWSLHPEGVAFFLSFNHDCRTDDVSNHGDVEDQVLAWLGSRQDGWQLQMVLENCSAWFASSVHLNLSWSLSNLKKGSPLSPSREMNQFKAAIHPASF
jgi:hypothetical protein